MGALAVPVVPSLRSVMRVSRARDLGEIMEINSGSRLRHRLLSDPADQCEQQGEQQTCAAKDAESLKGLDVSRPLKARTRERS